MRTLTVSNRTLELDNDGYLKRLDDWDREVAKELALLDDIALTPAHWEIIDLVRAFYRTFTLAPSQRPLVKFVRERLGEEKGRSVYLMRLFPGTPAIRVAKIAGLPRPTNCF